MTGHAKDEKVLMKQEQKTKSENQGDTCYRVVKAEKPGDQDLATVGGPALELAMEQKHSLEIVQNTSLCFWDSKCKKKI